jgi:hypothetical protein
LNQRVLFPACSNVTKIREILQKRRKGVFKKRSGCASAGEVHPSFAGERRAIAVEVFASLFSAEDDGLPGASVVWLYASLHASRLSPGDLPLSMTKGFHRQS